MKIAWIFEKESDSSTVCFYLFKIQLWDLMYKCLSEIKIFPPQTEGTGTLERLQSLVSNEHYSPIRRKSDESFSLCAVV